MPRRTVGVFAALLTLVLVAALVTPDGGAAQGEPSVLEAVEESCRTFNPFFVSTVFSRVEWPRDRPDETAIIAFRHTGTDDIDEQIPLATHDDVGAVYGLAYDAASGQLYAGAYHKRSTAYGPGGPGQVYRIDLATGSIERLVSLPSLDQHNYGENEDEPAAKYVGIASIGDLELSADGSTLFAVNLMDGRIYRIGLPDGQVLGSFRHGAVGEDWAINARVFALAFHDGRLYHGVVDSRTRTAAGSLRGFVYRSLPDGSAMEEVLWFPFDYGRQPLWRAWDSPLPRKVGDSYYQVYSEPILADIEFTLQGDMLLGIRDRVSDMLPNLNRYVRQTGVGDLLVAVASGGGWTSPSHPDPYDDLVYFPTVAYDELAWGGLAAFPGFDLVVSSARAPTREDGVGAFWFWNRTGQRMAEETWGLIASERKPNGANGAGDVESLCPRSDSPDPRAAPIATSVVATATARAIGTATAAAGKRTPTTGPVVTPDNFPTVVAEACLSENPYAATVCYPLVMNYGQAGVNAASVVVFRDTADNSPIYMAASHESVGSTWGLGYSSHESAIYSAAFHKRLVEFGPDGTGAVYRIDVGTGAVTTFAVVPDAGPVMHAEPGLREPDFLARDWAGKLSLGDLDLSADESELYVMNLLERSVFRYDVATGALLSRFEHGAAAESWADDARPFGLRFYDGRLYHGVVNSAETSERLDDLVARVYSSLPDGTDMALELEFPLDYPRGSAVIPGVVGNISDKTVPLDWLPWTSGYNDLTDKSAQIALYPQPLLADIEFTMGGDMVLGLRDRHADMALAYQINKNNQIRKPGVGLGDVLLARREAGGWSQPDFDYFRGLRVTIPNTNHRFDRTGMGGLALIESLDQILVGRVSATGLTGWSPGMNEEVIWYEDENNVRHEMVCRVSPLPYRTPVPQITAVPTRTPAPGASPVPLGAQLLADLIAPLAPLPSYGSGAPSQSRASDPSGLGEGPLVPQDNEWVPSRSLGDVEVLCGPSPTPSVTPVDSPTPTNTPTRTRTPTPTVSPSPSPTPTPDLKPIYLPILIDDHCDPRYQHVDVVLVLDSSTTMEFLTRADRPKIDAAKEAAGLFLDRMKFPGDQAAIVSFNAKAAVHEELTGNQPALRSALREIEVEEFTRIHLGIRAAHELLTSAKRIAINTPAMIVLTDGISNPDPVQMAIDAATAAKADGITIYTVGLGEDIEVEALKMMASRPGMYRHAPDGEDLGYIYAEIAHEVPCPPSAYWPYLP